MARHLVWDSDARAELSSLLERRSGVAAFAECINGKLLNVADDTKLAKKVRAPGNFREFIFRCDDGEVQVYMRAVVFENGENELIVLSIGTVVM